MKRIAVLIPAYNEAERIRLTIKSLRSHWSESTEYADTTLFIYVIDDNSSDMTSEEADNAGADVVLRLPERMGKGDAMEYGRNAAKDADYFLFLDADLGETAGKALILLKPLFENSADLIIGVLPHQERGGGGGFVVRLARNGIHELTGLELKAPLSGQRALTHAALEKLPPFATGFGVEVGMTIDAYRAELRITEIEVPLKHRVTKRDLRSWIHRFRQYLQVRKALISRKQALQKQRKDF